MKYEIVVTEKFTAKADEDTSLYNRTTKDTEIEDNIIHGSFVVTGRGNAYWLYTCVCEYIKKHFYDVGRFEIRLWRTHVADGKKVYRLIDSCVCRGALTCEEWGHQVDGFIMKEVIDDKGLFHKVSMEESEGNDYSNYPFNPIDWDGKKGE